MTSTTVIAFVGTGQVLHRVDLAAKVTACGRSTEGKEVRVDGTSVTCNACDGIGARRRRR